MEFDTVILTNDFLTDNKLGERKSRILYAKMLLNWFAGVMKRINPVFMAKILIRTLRIKFILNLQAKEKRIF